MQHSLIDPAKLHVFGESRKHQKMRKSVIQGCANLWGTSMSFLPNYLRRCKGPAVPKRDQQKMHRKSLYIFQTHEDARGPHVIDFPHLLLWYNHIINTVVNSCLKIRNNDDRDFALKNKILSNIENLLRV